jgi:hypothetical protein
VTESLGAVKGFRPEIIEAGTFPATVVDIKGMNGVRGPYAIWLFQPDGFSEDAQPAGFSSISAGRTSKGMEWARRILGKSGATDMLYGKDIKDKRPVVDWGAAELSGKPCRIALSRRTTTKMKKRTGISSPTSCLWQTATAPMLTTSRASRLWMLPTAK